MIWTTSPPWLRPIDENKASIAQLIGQNLLITAVIDFVFALAVIVFDLIIHALDALHSS